ncbi:MAG: hypothetical protein KGL39_31170 [Patescibacteria group bacterium]|nr:hypothetical protein [Patescibacteria group bacterium]
MAVSKYFTDDPFERKRIADLVAGMVHRAVLRELDSAEPDPANQMRVVVLRPYETEVGSEMYGGTRYKRTTHRVECVLANPAGESSQPLRISNQYVVDDGLIGDRPDSADILAYMRRSSTRALMQMVAQRVYDDND